MNDGINWNSKENLYWKHDVQRFEAVNVLLHGNAEFEAADVVLQVRLTLEYMISISTCKCVVVNFHCTLGGS